jgi:hypothetical protein
VLDRPEILLKVALNTINQPTNPKMSRHIDCQNSSVDKTHNAGHKLCLSKTTLDKTIFSRFKFNCNVRPSTVAGPTTRGRRLVNGQIPTLANRLRISPSKIIRRANINWANHINPTIGLLTAH